MRFDTPLVVGRLLRRYKRFLADIALDDGRTITAHTANPGAMTGLDKPGRRVLLSHHPHKKRKLPFTWEMVRIGGRWVGVNPLHANKLVAEALPRIAALSSYDSLRNEVRCGDSRIDLMLESASERCWVELKTVTLMDGDRALFPDAPTDRGRRHLLTLQRAAKKKDRAVLCFIAQRSDVRSVAPADHVDPAYGATLRKVSGDVEIMAYNCRVGPRLIAIHQRVPVVF